MCTENTIAVMPRSRKDVNCFVSPWRWDWRVESYWDINVFPGYFFVLCS